MNTFLIETFNRLFKSKSPVFFIRLRVIFGILTFANYIPSIIQRWFGVDVPGPTITMCEDIAKYCTGIFAALFLSASSSTVGQTTDGSAVKVTDDEKFPFTANKEKQKIEETNPPVLSEVQKPSEIINPLN